MRPIEINAVKNDVLDRLLRQAVLPEGIGLQLVEMASNPRNDPVWRDYCIQFMPPYYERVSAEGGTAEYTDSGTAEQTADELSAIHDAMFLALDERDCTMAGTALIGLEWLSRAYDEFDREAIATKASEIAADESVSDAPRVTALRLASMMSVQQGGVGIEHTAVTARRVAQTGETVLLRCTAIVTLGEIGTEADRELLNSFTIADDQQLADAAKLALQKMAAE
jgi:hypothetical protein